ncbi:Transcriptional regulator, AbiEi antitoxin, Type IV TA system [compost metagenome]
MNTKTYHIGHEALLRFEKHTGIEAHFTPNQGVENFTDGLIRFMDNRFHDVFRVEFKHEVRNHHLPALLKLKESSHHPFILIGQTIFPSVKEYLRKQGINYIDMAGNANIQTEEALIYIDGQKWQDETHPMLLNRAFTKTGLRVVFILLTDKKATGYSNRLLAELAGVSVGAVNHALSGLQTMGFLQKVNKTMNCIDSREALLERWISGFQERLKPTLHLGNFRIKGGVDNWETIRLDTNSYWSGEAAAYRLRNHLLPKTLTVYTGMDKLAFMKQHQLIPDTEGNLSLYQKFWNGPINGPTALIAPLLLAYADLMDTRDPRCVEEAQEIIKEYKI